MDQQALTALISKTAQLMEQFERRCDHIGTGLHASTKQMDVLTSQLPGVVRQSADTALGVLPEQVLRSTRQGLDQAAHQYQERLDASGRAMAESTRVMTAQIQRLEKLHRHLVWKTVGAVAMCIVLLAVGGSWLSMHYAQVIKQNQLSAQLMKAYNEADVTLCEGRLCAHVEPKARRFGSKGEYLLVAPR